MKQTIPVKPTIKTELPPVEFLTTGLTHGKASELRVFRSRRNKLFNAKIDDSLQR
jgi:hypothetical protein